MIRFTNVIQEIFALLKKASHLASDGDKTNRHLLFYMLGQSGQLANQKMGEKLGLTYLAMIHRVGVFENLL